MGSLGEGHYCDIQNPPATLRMSQDGPSAGHMEHLKSDICAGNCEIAKTCMANTEEFSVEVDMTDLLESLDSSKGTARVSVAAKHELQSPTGRKVVSATTTHCATLSATSRAVSSTPASATNSVRSSSAKKRRSSERADISLDEELEDDSFLAELARIEQNVNSHATEAEACAAPCTAPAHASTTCRVEDAIFGSRVLDDTDSPIPMCCETETAQKHKSSILDGQMTDKSSTGLERDQEATGDESKFRQFTVVSVDDVATFSRGQDDYVVLILQPKGGMGDGRPEIQGGRARRDQARVVLHDTWVDTFVAVGDVVVLINCVDTEDDGAWHLRFNSKELMVVHPHVLISASRLGDMLRCPRKALLHELVKDSDMQKSAVIGNLVHAVFQESMAKDKWTDEFILREIHRAISNNLTELVGVDMSSAEALTELTAFMENIKSFFNAYCGMAGRHEDTREAGAGAGVVQFGSEQEYRICLLRPAQDIEEMVCSSRYGLQGRMDATVEVAMFPVKGCEGDRRNVLLPFEIKSGKVARGLDHNLQVMLYSLLMPERYPRRGKTVHEANGGLLLYLKDLVLKGVAVEDSALPSIIQHRNKLATALTRHQLLPTIKEENKCNSCFARQTCALYHKAVEGGSAQSSGFPQEFDKLTSHLSEAQCHYFKQWHEMINLEEKHTLSQRKDVLSLPSTDQEKRGICCARMEVVNTCPVADEGGESGGTEMLVTLERADTDQEFLSVFKWQRRPLTELAFAEGDRVAVKHEVGFTGFAREAVVEEVTKSAIKLRLAKGLGGGDHDSVRMRAGTEVNACARNVKLWRVDRVEYGSSWGKARACLARFFLATSVASEAESDGARGCSGEGDRSTKTHAATSYAAKHRRFVVDLAAPSFDGHDADTQKGFAVEEAGCARRADGEAGLVGAENMNEEQQFALQRMLSAKVCT